MEHRCFQRKPMELDVVINYRALGLVQGRTVNVGLGGMYVETGRIQLPINAIVETSVMLQQDDGRPKAISAKAMVVHNRGKGAGLMFSELDEGLQDALKSLIVLPGELDEVAAI